MEEDFLRDHPELRPFVLSDVQLTGTRIGSGAYGRVEEVAFPMEAAAKTLFAFLQEGDDSSPNELSKAAAEFVRECQLMSTVRHPNVVQFLGVAFFPGSRLPSLVMERLLTSLHGLLAPDTPPGATSPLAFFSAVLKCSVLHNVACGLAYLHERSPPVIHRDLSARNVLLNSEMVAKIADLGVARIVPRMRAAATMTMGPGASVYMPPEASAPATSNTERSKYDASIDIFSLGVVTIFTIGGTFPCDPLSHNYFDERSGLLVARTELQRRSGYMAGVNQQLRACGQLRGDHPLIRLIQRCLENLPAARPGIHEVLRLLEEARAGFRDGESERNRRHLVRALQTQPRNQNMRCVLRDLVTENADLQSRVVEIQSRHQGEELCSLRRELVEQSQGYEDTIATMERELEQERQAIERKEGEFNDLNASFKDISQQLQNQREMTLRASENLTQARDTERLVAQRQIEEKETELQLKSSTCNNLESELDQKKVEIVNLQEQLRHMETKVSGTRQQLRKQNVLAKGSKMAPTGGHTSTPMQARMKPKQKKSTTASSFTIGPQQTLDEAPKGEVKEKDAMNMLCAIANKWKQLGTEFDIDNSELEAIKMKHNAPMEWLLEVIATKKARTPGFSWAHIVQALRAIKQNNIADRICREYNIFQPQSHSNTTANVVVLSLQESSESKLKGKFSELITFAIRILERRGEVFFKDFKSYVITYFSLDSKILEATGYRQVFDQISHENRWDYMNYFPLLEILNHFLPDEADEMCLDYQHAVNAYHATEKMTESLSRSDLAKLCHEDQPLDIPIHEIHMKLYPHKVSRRSMSYIHSVWDSMSQFLSIPSVETVIDSMPRADTEADCLSATLPPQTRMRREERFWREFMKQYDIMEISFDNGHILS